MSKSVTQYVAVLADAVGSRRLAAPARQALQQQLRAALTTANRKWRKTISARFAITLGDQLEGLLTLEAPLWDIVHYLRAELDGDWIIACGRGPLSTAPGPSVIELDGPCFHEAREALERAKQQRLVLAFGGYDAVANAFGAYYSALYWTWTSRQRQAAALLRTMEPAAVAERLGVDRSAISHLTRRISWRQVEAGDAAFRKYLETAP
ncbi:MAG TPA: SatD family protein [Gemmatimonadales bacterium]|jgi:hypothetical protein|nr:SatD family protein [Gemmatimonadales bacterium]